MPSPLSRQVRGSLFARSTSIVGGLPCEKVRSAPAIIVSGPAQRSLALWPARSRSRLATLSIESSGSFVASTAVSIATGWSEPVPGREFHPLKSSAFHGALLRQIRARKPNRRRHDRFFSIRHQLFREATFHRFRKVSHTQTHSSPAHGGGFCR